MFLSHLGLSSTTWTGQQQSINLLKKDDNNLIPSFLFLSWHISFLLPRHHWQSVDKIFTHLVSDPVGGNHVAFADLCLGRNGRIHTYIHMTKCLLQSLRSWLQPIDWMICFETRWALQQLFCNIRTNLVSVEVATGGSPHRDKVAGGSSLPVWSELRLIYIGWSWFMMYELKPNRSGFVLSVVQMLAAYFLLYMLNFFCRTLICWKGHCSI